MIKLTIVYTWEWRIIMNNNFFEKVKNAQNSQGMNEKQENSNTIKESMDEIRAALEAEITNGDYDDEKREKMLEKVNMLCNSKTNIMLVGATGCGKSSTINAMFGVGVSNEKSEKDESSWSTRMVEVAKVGTKADPQTKDIEKYSIGNLVLWDTPGLGDGTQIDEHHKEIISELLDEEDEEGNALIDLVLVILDGSTKDLGTSYKILNEVIIPGLGDETDRIVVALNQADIAMKTGRHWDYEKNEPDSVLVDFLEEKVESIKRRIKEDSGLDISPIYYCAGYTEESGDTVYPYNLSKLLMYILNALPSYKRVAIMENVNTDADNYEHNDDDMDYSSAVKSSFLDTFDYYVSEGVDKGIEVGSTILGIPGGIVGGIIGGAVGCIRSFLDGLF